MLDEKERLTDALITQKHLTGVYNLAAVESLNTRLRETFMNILAEEHQIHLEILDEMKNRGWYQPDKADISRASQKVNTWVQELQKIKSPGAQLHKHYQSGIPYHSYPSGLGLTQTPAAAPLPPSPGPSNLKWQWNSCNI